MGKGVQGARVTRRIVALLCAQGWSVTLRNGQYIAVPPVKDRGIVIFSETPGEFRSVRNTLSDLRRSGADTSKMPKG